ncbi:hypothetical protein HY373_02505 [Candidatus Berkelbacteria bacterium]|nr:hypothetical protein [Candidatus Berkelbacteria bacterium]
MVFQHKNLAAGRWFGLTLVEQLANVGSEVIRALNWRKKGDEKSAKLAFERALELLDLTLADGRHRKRFKEVARLREVLVEYFDGKNLYGYTPESLENYFYAFNYYRITHLEGV